MFSQGARCTLQLFNDNLEINWEDGEYVVEVYLHSYKAEKLTQRFYCDMSQWLTESLILSSVFSTAEQAFLLLSYRMLQLSKLPQKEETIPILNNVFFQIIKEEREETYIVNIVSAITQRDQGLSWESGQPGVAGAPPS